MAPARSASSRSACMWESSSAVAGRRSIPTVMTRSVLWPTCITELTETGGKPSRYSANVVSRNVSHGALAARYSRSMAAVPGSAGAAEKPQLPTTSVVTPWRIFPSARGLRGSVKSECVWMSMKPGATTWPRASMTRRAGRARLDGGGAVAGDEHLRLARGRAHPVEHQPSPDRQIVHVFTLPSRLRPPAAIDDSTRATCAHWIEDLWYSNAPGPPTPGPT